MDNRDIIKNANISGLSADAISYLADSADIGLWNWHLPSDEIRLNRQIAQLTGYELGEIPHRGSTRNALIYEEDKDMVQRNIDALVNGEKDNYRIEYRMHRKDGSLVWIFESAFVYEWDEDGKPVRLAAVALDLSRLKKAEQKARNMETELRRVNTLQSQGDLADQNRMFRAATSSAATLIGDFYHDYETVLTLSLQILGESVQADRAFIWRNTVKDNMMIGCFLRAEWACNEAVSHGSETEEDSIPYDDFFQNWREVLAEGHYVFARTQDLDPKLRALDSFRNSKTVMLVPLYLNDVFWGVMGFDNCSDDEMFTRSEAEIMEAGGLIIASSISRNETYGRLTRSREEALASAKAKSEFLSRMSHEIRTPMNAIIGMTTIAKKTDDPVKIKYCLDKVDVSSRQLLSIINDVLDMSKIDADKFEIMNGEFDFDRMLQNVFNVVQIKLDEKHQEFSYDYDQPFTHKVISDELRLSQVLINLLNNATKFTPEGGNIILKIRQNPSEDGQKCRLHVEVIDTGIGIDEKAQKRLFNSFEQADGSITREYGGSGLGLAICKKIIDLMGGEIWVQSEVGKGTTFLFEVETGIGDEICRTNEEGVAPEELRVLVVDDSDDVLEYFSNILSGFSIDCDTALGGREAIRAVQKALDEGHPYDMVFIDWNMPDINGGGTAREIRKIMDDKIIVVMISVSDWADIEPKAREYGVTNFLGKPILPSTLYNTITELTKNTLVKEKICEENEEKDWRDKRILLVEDIEINREIVASVLEETGIQIDNAENGAQAVQIFQDSGGKYDAILMDVQMPVLDGLGATKQIRAIEELRGGHIPIIAMTANAFKEDEKLCMEAGMDAHVAKPLSVDELFSVLSTYLDGE